MVFDVSVSRDEKAACASGGVLYDFPLLRPYQTDDAVNQRSGGKILPCSRFLFRSVLFKEAFVKIAKSLFSRRKPIQFVDRIGERLQIRRLAQFALSIRENRKHELVFSFLGIAKIKQ